MRILCFILVVITVAAVLQTEYAAAAVFMLMIIALQLEEILEQLKVKRP